MMKYRRNASSLGFAVGACVIAMLVGTAMAGNNPADENWWPSEFGEIGRASCRERV